MSLDKYELAEKIASSVLIAGSYRHKPADVYMGLEMSEKLGVNLGEFLNNVYISGGKPCMTTALMISLVNRSGKFKEPIQFISKGEGDSLEVTAFAHLQSGNRVTAGITMKQAHQEGWTRNKMYQSLPELMLRYKSAAFLIRTFAPEVTLSGIHSVEEMQDVEAKSLPDSNNKINKLNQTLNKG